MVATPEPDPPRFPNELVASAGERPALETFPGLYRGAIVGKVAGVSEEDARSRLVGSATTLGGIVKHLRWVDDVAPHSRMGEVSLRWIDVQMIEETARHAGHADILGEQLDGTTGS